MPTGDAFNEAERLCSLVELFKQGVDSGAHAVRYHETMRQAGFTLNKGDRYGSDENFSKVVERARKTEIGAKNEIDSGYSSLYSLAIVRLWTILENSISRLVRLRLGDNSILESSPILRKLNGPIVEFLLSNPDERIDALYEELVSQLKVRLKPGVGRFEAILDAVGLSGEVDDDIRRELIELWAVRNVIVHSGGRCDQRFLHWCPCYPALKDQPVVVSPLVFNVYLSAALWYVLSVENRWRVVEKEEVPSDSLELLAEFKERIRNIRTKQ